MRFVLLVFLLGLLLSPAPAAAGSATLTGFSNLMNPAISVNGLFLAQTSRDDDGEAANGIDLQEAEIHFASTVDPFWKASVIAAIEPAEGGSSYEIGVEEACIDATSLPAGLAMKLGKFFLPFGKHAPMHTHHFPFVEAPRAVTLFLGEGLTDAGGLVAYALPLPWFSDLSAYAVDGNGAIFDGADRDLAYGGRWTNLWDLSDETTLEVGGSALAGPRSPGRFGPGGRYAVYGADLTVKWISSARSHGPALTLQAEAFLPDRGELRGEPLGWYALAQYRLHHNWWAGAAYGRADAGRDDPAALDSEWFGEYRESSANLTFAPSEFSALRVEVSHVDDRTGDGDDLRFALQWNFTIGSHPAHLY